MRSIWPFLVGRPFQKSTSTFSSDRVAHYALDVVPPKMLTTLQG